MQVNQRYIIEQAPPLKTSQYKCTQCLSGQMMPVTEEGESDYTEYYACNQCVHRDTIPTLVIIISQMLSSLVGVSVCLHLAIDHSSQLSTLSAQDGTLVAQQSLLILMSCLFIACFLYVMYQSVKGALHRHQYARSIPNQPVSADESS